MKRVAIYSRKSKETDTGESIKNQIKMCKDYFLRNDEEYEFEVFQDEGFSGGNTNRPQFQHMILLAKHNQFDIIACYKVDRIGRNIVDFMNTFDILQKHNVSLVSITEGFDPDTPAGRMMMTMIAGFAEMERMNIAQRVKDNMESLAKLGRWSGGTCPTGYKSVKISTGTKYAMYLELIPELENKIKTIFDLASNGMTCAAIGKQLNMSNKSISNIISNPVYCKSDYTSKNYLESLGYTVYGECNGNGYIAYNRRPRTKNGKKLFNAENMFVAISIHTAPIESEIWIKANENLKSRGQLKKPRISEFSWLAHLVKCKNCGAGMIVAPGHYKKNGTRNYYFKCSQRCGIKWANARYLEDDIIEIFMNINKDKTILQEYIHNSSSVIDYSSKIKKLNNDLKRNNIMLDKLSDKLVLLEGTALQTIINKMNSISKENEVLNELILKTERERILNNKDLNIDILKDNINRFLSLFDNLSMSEKQYAIQTIIKSVEWDGAKPVINLLQ